MCGKHKNQGVNLSLSARYSEKTERWDEKTVESRIKV